MIGQYSREQWRAHQTLNRAVKHGYIHRLPCRICGCKRTEGHHEDYAKPLEVTWLCRKHHAKIHSKGNTNRPKSSAALTANIAGQLALRSQRLVHDASTGWTASDLTQFFIGLLNRAMKNSHCRKGHAFALDNVYLRKNGQRECKQCSKDRGKRKPK